MVHRQTLDAVLAIVVAWAVLFTVPFFIPQIVWPLNLQIGIIVTATLAIFSVVYFYLTREAAQEVGPIQVGVKVSEAKPETTRPLQLVPGGDELLRELERVEASCGRIVQSLGVSGHDINPLIIELNHLRFTLVQLAGKYTGQWLFTLDNRVTMVADQLGEASSVLSEKTVDIEHVKAHIDGAVQNAKSLIRELKSEAGHGCLTVPQSSQRFHTVYGADELLRELETVGTKGQQWGSLITDNAQEAQISIVEREADYHYHELLKLSVYYGKTWDLTLQNRIKVIYAELERGSSTLRKGRVDEGEAHIDTALDSVRSLIAYLKSPPSS